MRARVTLGTCGCSLRQEYVSSYVRKGNDWRAGPSSDGLGGDVIDAGSG
jgi:hypothetical protein